MAPSCTKFCLKKGSVTALASANPSCSATSKASARATAVLRSIARLDFNAVSGIFEPPAVPQGTLSTEDPHSTITEWRAANIYLSLNGSRPLVGSDQMSVQDTLLEVCNYKAQKRRGCRPATVITAFRNILQSLQLSSEIADCSWTELDSSVELPCAIVALALAFKPSVILLDGHPGPVAFSRIQDAILSTNTAILWNCDERTARFYGVVDILHLRDDVDDLASLISVRPARDITSSLQERSCVSRACNATQKRRLSTRGCSKNFSEVSVMAMPWIAMMGYAMVPVRAALTDIVSYPRELVVQTVRTMVADGPLPVTVAQLALCSVLVFAVAGMSWWYEIGLESKYLVAATRCAVQLSLLGIILVPIFQKNLWWQVIGYISLMMLVAAQDCASRPPYKFRTRVPMYFWILASFGCTTVVLISFVLFVVLQVGLRALEAIPIGGMVMQNCLSATAVALSNCLTTFVERKDSIEILLALGATRFEATRPLVRRSVVLGLTPMIALMSTAGIVSMSGMMTGQLLGGADPSTAARYQIIIMFLISCSTFTCAMTASMLTTVAVIDSEHRIRSDLIVEQSSGMNFADFIGKMFRSVWSLMAWRQHVIAETTPLDTGRETQVSSMSYGSVNRNIGTTDVTTIKGTQQLKTDGTK